MSMELRQAYFCIKSTIFWWWVLMVSVNFLCFDVTYHEFISYAELWSSIVMCTLELGLWDCHLYFLVTFFLLSCYNFKQLICLIYFCHIYECPCRFILGLLNAAWYAGQLSLVGLAEGWHLLKNFGCLDVEYGPGISLKPIWTLELVAKIRLAALLHGISSGTVPAQQK
jgi:hypothetical protein